MKQGTDTDTMIAILENAIRLTRVEHPGSSGYTTHQEIAVAMELANANLIVIQNYHNPKLPFETDVHIEGVTLAGRRYLDELRREKRQAKLLARLGRFTWAVGGWLAGVATVIIGAGAKALFDFFFGR